LAVRIDELDSHSIERRRGKMAKSGHFVALVAAVGVLAAAGLLVLKVLVVQA
jgi:hypothetical protein